MKVYRISKCQYIDDLSGKGAALYGGRWNNKGTYVLYTAATPALALLETVVHVNTIPVSGYCMATIELPGADILVLTEKDLPRNWQHNPPPSSLKKIGDRFIKEGLALALQLPSVIIPQDHNILINPKHPQFKTLRLVEKRFIPFDDRLRKK
jgi:RES domain-containing protein